MGLVSCVNKDTLFWPCIWPNKVSKNKLGQMKQLLLPQVFHADCCEDLSGAPMCVPAVAVIPVLVSHNAINSGVWCAYRAPDHTTHTPPSPGRVNFILTQFAALSPA